MQNVNLGQQLDSIQEPGILVSLFNSSDPVVHKNIFGIARFDLAKRTFQFTPDRSRGRQHAGPAHHAGS